MTDSSGEAVLVVMLGRNITHETHSRQGSHACDVAVSINYSGVVLLFLNMDSDFAVSRFGCINKIRSGTNDVIRCGEE